MIQSQPVPSLSTQPVVRPTFTARLEKLSLWVWVPYVWLFFTSTRALSGWIAGGKAGLTLDADSSGNPLDRLLMTVLILLGLFVLLSRTERTKRILASNKWLLALFVLIALSVIWSNFPSISLRRSIRSIGTLVMVLVVQTERNPPKAVRTLLRALYFVHIPLSIIAIKYFRSFGVVYGWNGIEQNWVGLSTDKNSLGQVAMCSGLFCIWEVLQDWPKLRLKLDPKKLAPSTLVLLLSFFLLRGSKNVHSSTAIIGFVICFVVLIGLQYIRKRSAYAKRIILAGSIVFAILAPLGYFAVQLFDTTPVQVVLQATGRDMTFTDRTLIWSDVINDAARSPVLGVGIGAFWVGPIGYEMYPMPNWSRKTPEWRPEEAHNGFLDAYVQLGVVGEVLLLIVTGVAFSGALSHLESDFQFGSLRLMLLLVVVICNMTETSLLDGTHGLWFLFLLAAVNYPVTARRAGAKTPARARSLHAGPGPYLLFKRGSRLVACLIPGRRTYQQRSIGAAVMGCLAIFLVVS